MQIVPIRRRCQAFMLLMPSEYIYLADNAHQIWLMIIEFEQYLLEGVTKPVITNNGDGPEIINLEL